MVKHLKHYYPDWHIGIETRPGLSPILEGIADEAHDLFHPMPWRNVGEWDKKHYFPLERPSEFCSRMLVNVDADVPRTKVSECLARYFPGLDPIEELYKYSITINDTNKARADKWITEELQDKPFAIVHPWGTARKESKDLTEWELSCLLGMIVDAGMIPVVLFFDWPVPDFLLELGEREHRVVTPDQTHELWQDVKKKKTGNAQVIARLIDRAEIFLGIDSGPAHLAGCSPITTPSHIFWVYHHPITCFDLSGNPNLHHYVSDRHYVPDQKPLITEDARMYFEANYKYTYYEGSLTNYVEHLFRSVVYG